MLLVCLLLLLLCQASLSYDLLHCYHHYARNVRPFSNCRQLLASMPSGPHGTNLTDLGALVSPNAPFYPQAIFTNFNCQIEAGYYAGRTPPNWENFYFADRLEFAGPDGPNRSPETHLYEATIGMIWEAVREAAEAVLRECVEGGDGEGGASGPLEIQEIQETWYMVFVRRIGPETRENDRVRKEAIRGMRGNWHGIPAGLDEDPVQGGEGNVYRRSYFELG